MRTDWSVPLPDPKVFHDPFALEIGWDSMTGGSTNIVSRRFESASPIKAEFVPTSASLGVAHQIQWSGLALIALSSWAIVKQHAYSLFIGIIFGFGFLAVGMAVSWFIHVPIVFDRSLGLFWKGRQNPKQDPAQVPTPGTGVLLNQIHAIQLLTKRVLMRGIQGRGGSNYLSYQLNLVLKDKTRVTVIDHAGIQASREDAKKLAEFLSVPLWDTAKSETDLLPPDASKLETWIAKSVDKID